MSSKEMVSVWYYVYLNHRWSAHSWPPDNQHLYRYSRYSFKDHNLSLNVLFIIMVGKEIQYVVSLTFCRHLRYQHFVIYVNYQCILLIKYVSRVKWHFLSNEICYCKLVVCEWETGVWIWQLKWVFYSPTLMVVFNGQVLLF